jgi:hypothetical protein
MQFAGGYNGFEGIGGFMLLDLGFAALEDLPA